MTNIFILDILQYIYIIYSVYLYVVLWSYVYNFFKTRIICKIFFQTVLSKLANCLENNVIILEARFCHICWNNPYLCNRFEPT